MTRRRALGRGLDALLSPTSAESSDGAESSIRELAIDDIRPNPYQPRQLFDEGELGDLADSIATHGLIQPLVVADTDDGFVLIAGERRWRASRIAGLKKVPIVVRSADPREMLAIAIVENVQRSNLDAIETASGFKRLIDEFELTQAEVAALVGRSRTAVANTVRLLGLEDEIKSLITTGLLSEGHGRALLGLATSADRIALAKRAVDGGWPVRRVEAEVRLANVVSAPEAPRSSTRVGNPEPEEPVRPDPNTSAAERSLEDVLGTNVQILRRGEGGRLIIHFYSEEELSALYQRIVGRLEGDL